MPVRSPLQASSDSTAAAACASSRIAASTGLGVSNALCEMPDASRRERGRQKHLALLGRAAHAGAVKGVAARSTASRNYFMNMRGDVPGIEVDAAGGVIHVMAVHPMRG